MEEATLTLQHPPRAHKRKKVRKKKKPSLQGFKFTFTLPRKHGHGNDTRPVIEKQDTDTVGPGNYYIFHVYMLNFFYKNINYISDFECSII